MQSVNSDMNKSSIIKLSWAKIISFLNAMSFDMEVTRYKNVTTQKIINQRFYQRMHARFKDKYNFI